jgi:zinc protease
MAANSEAKLSCAQLQRLGPATFSIDVALKPGVDPDKVSQAVDLELQALAAAGASHAEIAQAQSSTRPEIVFEENIPAAAQLVGSAVATGRTLGDLKAWSQRVSAVTAEQVHEAAQTFLISDRSVTGVLLPR